MDWDRVAEDYLAVAQEVFGSLHTSVDEVADEMAACIKAGHKVLACGNGGSAADAQHFAGELVNRFLRERKPYAGLALTTDTSVLTSIGNDYGYDQVFEKQVQALGQEGDILLAISTSGNAECVNRAVQAAKAMGIRTIGLTGGNGGQLANLAARCLVISCTNSVPRIQEGHQLIYHALCERIEEVLD
jgi:D-sedoheptulose 7-phosphate isomerase